MIGRYFWAFLYATCGAVLASMYLTSPLGDYDACVTGVSKAVLHLATTDQLKDAPKIDAILSEACPQ